MGTCFENGWIITQNITHFKQLNVVVARRSNMEGQTWLVTFKQNHVKLALAFMNIMNVVHQSKILQMICQRIISCCIFQQINQMLCTLACVVEMKPHTCKRWPHLSIRLLGNKISSMWEMCVGGWPQNYFLFMVN